MHQDDDVEERLWPQDPNVDVRDRQNDGPDDDLPPWVDPTFLDTLQALGTHVDVETRRNATREHVAAAREAASSGPGASTHEDGAAAAPEDPGAPSMALDLTGPIDPTAGSEPEDARTALARTNDDDVAEGEPWDLERDGWPWWMHRITGENAVPMTQALPAEPVAPMRRRHDPATFDIDRTARQPRRPAIDRRVAEDRAIDPGPKRSSATPEAPVNGSWPVQVIALTVTGLGIGMLAPLLGLITLVAGVVAIALRTFPSSPLRD